MKIDVHLRHTETGDTNIYHSPVDYTDLRNIEYMYGEGNYSCNCNRLLFLYDWSIDDERISCGSGLVAIDKITDRDTDEVLFEDL